jgi:hypothetical protein
MRRFDRSSVMAINTMERAYVGVEPTYENRSPANHEGDYTPALDLPAAGIPMLSCKGRPDSSGGPG